MKITFWINFIAGICTIISTIILARNYIGMINGWIFSVIGFFLIFIVSGCIYLYEKYKDFKEKNNKRFEELKEELKQNISDDIQNIEIKLSDIKIEFLKAIEKEAQNRTVLDEMLGKRINNLESSK